MNKRSAMLLDRLMYNLKEIMRKIPKDQIENGGQGKSGGGLNQASERVNCINLLATCCFFIPATSNPIGLYVI